MKKGTRGFAHWASIMGLFCVFLSCPPAGREGSVEQQISAFLDAEAARPRLLFDHDEMMAYLKAFPYDHYRLYKTRNGFSYYVEKEARLDGIKQVISRGGVWEDKAIEVMARYIRPGSTVVDAGAYIGTHSLVMAKLAGPRGRAFAFEPQKKIFRELVFNLIQNKARNVTPLRFALGEADRIVEMTEAVDGVEGLVQIGEGGDRAELRTLDSFALEGVSFLKIDVEGYEANVLAGARKMLAASGFPPILVEIQDSDDYSKSEGAFSELENGGYAVRRLPYRDFLAMPAPLYALGTVLAFDRDGSAEPFKTGWWEAAERWGTWMIGPFAGLVLPLSEAPLRDLSLSVSARAADSRDGPPQAIEVCVNGRRVALWPFEDAAFRWREARIPVSLISGRPGRPVLRITFRNLKPRPEGGRPSADVKRALSLGVRQLTVREA